MRIQDMKIAPHLFVGLGGCGSQIVNEIARKLKRRTAEYERYRNLVHFFAFDTDMGELKRCEMVDQWVPISQFDKAQFVEHSFGMRGASEDELFTSWWPEYYQPRVTSGVGAGQIRIESRLSIYRTLKAMPQYLTAIRNAIRRGYDSAERWRDPDKQPMVHVYASLAGGTGSGAFLSIAYLMRDLISPHQNPITVGTFVLPAVFKGMGLPAQQLDKIMANGYAALCELEHLQSAKNTPAGRIRFQYDPIAKEPLFATHGPFNQVHLVDDVGKLSAVLADPRRLYPYIADAAYAQIFSDIIERDRSTADNDEREIAVADEQGYTKRYGSFGLTVLVLPDRDILEYAAHRFAAEALTRAFALAQEDASMAGAAPLTPEQRERDFVRELGARARLPGETGAFYRATLEWVDGSGSAGIGALAEMERRIDAQLPRLEAPAQKLPRIGEEWLLEFDEQPDEVRIQLARRLEAWKEAVAAAKEGTLAEAGILAREVAGDAYDHSLGKLIGSVGALRERLLLIRLEESLRRRQAAAGASLRDAQAKLNGWEERYVKWAKDLEEAAPRSLLERFTGNDYADEKVPSFVSWHRDSMAVPQAVALRADGELEVYDALLQAISARRERIAALFGELHDIRRELHARAEELRSQGVPREAGGQASEHMLDVEVYQNHLDPRHGRLWNVAYGLRIKPDHFDPEEIARTIQEAERAARSRRHVRPEVTEALVALGRRRLGTAIVGTDEPRGLDELGLNIRAGLEEEARISSAWRKLAPRHRSMDEVPLEDWQVVMSDVPRDEIEDYVGDKLSYAARMCAPFWRLAEDATKIEPKRYITAYPDYLKDEWLRGHLLSLEHFNVGEGNLLKSPDPKRIVFYWNEMGAAIYKVTSVDEYGQRYEFVKMDELRRGPIYREAELRYRSCRAEFKDLVATGEGRKCPDIPLHTDRAWEGAPDPALGLFPLTMRAVEEGRARRAWEKAREQQAEARQAARRVAQRAEIRAFALCRALGLIASADGGYVWTIPEIERPEDRQLGRFLDEAWQGFGRVREVLKAFALKRMEQRLAEVGSARDRRAIEGLLRPHMTALEVARLNAGEREASVLSDELAVLEDELAKLLGRC